MLPAVELGQDGTRLTAPVGSADALGTRRGVNRRFLIPDDRAVPRGPGRPDHSRHTDTTGPVSRVFRSAAEDRCGMAYHRWGALPHRSWKRCGRGACGPPSPVRAPGVRGFHAGACQNRRARSRAGLRPRASQRAAGRPWAGAPELLQGATRPDLTITKPAAYFSAGPKPALQRSMRRGSNLGPRVSASLSAVAGRTAASGAGT